MSNSKHISNN